MFEFDVRFYTKVVQFIMFSYETRIGQRCFSLTADDLVDFNTNTYCLDETSSVACNSGETQTLKVLILSGRDRPLTQRYPRKRVARGRKL